MIREKRLRWFGHLVREDEDDVARESMMYQINDLTKWGKQLIKDFEQRKINKKQAFSLAMDKANWRNISHARIPLYGGKRGSRRRKTGMAADESLFNG